MVLLRVCVYVRVFVRVCVCAYACGQAFVVVLLYLSLFHFLEIFCSVVR